MAPYASAMRATLCILFLISIPAAGQVYKGTDSDGRPLYTDRPLPDTTPLALPARPQASSDQPDPEGASTENGFVGPYQSFEIVAPEAGATIRDAEGRVAVSLLVDPPVQSAHRLSVEVDGVPATGDLEDRTQLELSGLGLGSHQLQVRLLDESEAVVAATPVIHIHIRQPLPEGSLP